MKRHKMKRIQKKLQRIWAHNVCKISYFDDKCFVWYLMALIVGLIFTEIKGVNN